MLHRLKRLFQKEAADSKNSFHRISHAQNGEDILINNYFELRGIYAPSFIDIGAHHPTFLSNTALMYRKGGRGVNIEANPALIELFKAEREFDINVHAGVGSVSGKAPFFIMEDAALSSFSKVETDVLVEQHGHVLKEVINIPMLTLHEILLRYCHGQFPDFMNIDVEGVDMEIFQTMDCSGSKPKMICAETSEYSPSGNGRKKTELIELIQSKGYTVFGDTYINTIFVETNWFKSSQSM